MLEKVIKLFDKDYTMKKKYIEILFQVEIIENILILYKKTIYEILQPKSLEILKNCLRLINKICYYSNSSCIYFLKAGIIQYADILIKKIEEYSQKGKFNYII